MKLNITNDKEKIKCIGEALSNNNRLEMLLYIKAHNGECSHKELAEILGIRSSSITFHLNSLIDAGLISENDGVGMLGRKNKNPKLKIKKIEIEL